VGYIVSPRNVVYVTTLPCKILTMTFSYTLLQKSSFCLGTVLILANFCRMIFKRRVLLIFPCPVPVRPRGRLVITMVADDVTGVNFCFKHFVTAVGFYAATNPL